MKEKEVKSYNLNFLKGTGIIREPQHTFQTIKSSKTQQNKNL
jgi:hypothetical protein